MIDHVSPPPPCLPAGQPCAQPRWSLIVAVLGSSMAFVDGTVVNVALPVIQRGLGAGVDRRSGSSRRMRSSLPRSSSSAARSAIGSVAGASSCAGVALFALASAACGLAPICDVAHRRASRAGRRRPRCSYRGASRSSARRIRRRRGAPQSAPGRRPRGSRRPSARSSAAVVVAHASWRWLFFFNLPVGVGTALARDRSSGRHTRRAGGAARRRRGGAAGDRRGSGRSCGLCSRRRTPAGWLRRGPLAALLGGLATLVGFVVVEARVSEPMVPLGLFPIARVRGGQRRHGAPLRGARRVPLLRALQSHRSAALLARGGGSGAPAPRGLRVSPEPMVGPVVARVGPRLPMVTGSAVTAAGFVLLAAARGRRLVLDDLLAGADRPRRRHGRDRHAADGDRDGRRGRAARGGRLGHQQRHRSHGGPARRRRAGRPATEPLSACARARARRDRRSSDDARLRRAQRSRLAAAELPVDVDAPCEPQSDRPSTPRS